jgi:hypothetical protein
MSEPIQKPSLHKARAIFRHSYRWQIILASSMAMFLLELSMCLFLPYPSPRISNPSDIGCSVYTFTPLKQTAAQP